LKGFQPMLAPGHADHLSSRPVWIVFSWASRLPVLVDSYPLTSSMHLSAAENHNYKCKAAKEENEAAVSNYNPIAANTAAPSADHISGLIRNDPNDDCFSNIG